MDLFFSLILPCPGFGGSAFLILFGLVCTSISSLMVDSGFLNRIHLKSFRYGFMMRKYQFTLFHYNHFKALGSQGFLLLVVVFFLTTTLLLLPTTPVLLDVEVLQNWLCFGLCTKLHNWFYSWYTYLTQQPEPTKVPVIFKKVAEPHVKDNLPGDAVPIFSNAVPQATQAPHNRPLGSDQAKADFINNSWARTLTKARESELGGFNYASIFTQFKKDSPSKYKELKLSKNFESTFYDKLDEMFHVSLKIYTTNERGVGVTYHTAINKMSQEELNVLLGNPYLSKQARKVIYRYVDWHQHQLDSYQHILLDLQGRGQTVVTKNMVNALKDHDMVTFAQQKVLRLEKKLNLGKISDMYYTQLYPATSKKGGLLKYYENLDSPYSLLNGTKFNTHNYYHNYHAPKVGQYVNQAELELALVENLRLLLDHLPPGAGV